MGLTTRADRDHFVRAVRVRTDDQCQRGDAIAGIRVGDGRVATGDAHRASTFGKRHIVVAVVGPTAAVVGVQVDDGGGVGGSKLDGTNIDLPAHNPRQAALIGRWLS